MNMYGNYTLIPHYGNLFMALPNGYTIIHFVHFVGGLTTKCRLEEYKIN